MSRCAHCGAVLASTSRPDRTFCGTACRVAAHRLRHARPTGPDWRAAAWTLEHRYPERWGDGARGLDAELEELWT